MPNPTAPERPKRIHALKIWPQHFAAILDGTKTGEVRLNDRAFAVGDEVNLREYDPAKDAYTGRADTRVITHILRDFAGLRDGYVALSYAPSAPEQARPAPTPASEAGAMIYCDCGKDYGRTTKGGCANCGATPRPQGGKRSPEVEKAFDEFVQLCGNYPQWDIIASYIAHLEAQNTLVRESLATLNKCYLHEVSKPAASAPSGLVEADVDRLLETLKNFDVRMAAIGGCTDGYCCVTGTAKGMHTNGGCQCWREKMTAQRVMRQARTMRDDLEPLRVALAAYYKGDGK